MIKPGKSKHRYRDGILVKHLTGQENDWPLYLPISTLIYNFYNIPNLGGLSPFELV